MSAEARALLAHLVQDPTESRFDQVRQMADEMTVSSTGVDAAIQVAKDAGFTVGTKVGQKRTGRVGKVVGYNKRSFGFNTGDRCPVMVDWSCGAGTFEYSTESLYIIT